MRVLINRLTALRQKTGIGHYVAQLVPALRLLAEENAIHLYPGDWEARALRLLGGLRPSRKPGPAQRDSTLGLWLHRLGRKLSDCHFRWRHWRSFDVYHEPNAIPIPSPWPTVATVCDLSVLLYPPWHPRDRVAHYERHFAAGLARCRHIVTISEFSRQEIIRHFSVAPERITVTYPGIGPRWRPLPNEAVAATRRRLELPGSFLLHVGTLEPRKNLLMLLRAYAALPSASRERCPLVLVGGWGWNVEELRRFYDEVARHRGVRWLGYVPDDDLPALYNAARALVFPTRYEGFGFPPLEMFACGGAALTSTAGAVNEVAGTRAHLIDPDNEPGWTDAMSRVIHDDDWLAHLRTDACAAARPFTWERCAAETWRAYQLACAPRQAAAG